MIARILQKSSSFSAVEYNEEKVREGVAELVEIQNMGPLQGGLDWTVQNTRNYLLCYSDRNMNIKYPQFHLAFSCKGQEYSKEELVKLAHQYLDQMGYGKEGQPLLIYFHKDTDNNHLHVITSRVDPEGHKIDHHHERRRSQKVLDEILNIDRNNETVQIVENAKTYKFETVKQFMAIMEAGGYETYEDEGKINIKKGGGVITSVDVAEIQRLLTKKDDDYERRRKQLRAVMKKYKEMASSQDEFFKMMKDKFGLQMVMLGSKLKPYGYLIVDHKDKRVLKGSDVLPLKELSAFQPKEEKIQNINLFIDKKLESYHGLTTKKLNSLLRKEFGCYLFKGKLVIGNEKRDINDLFLAVLKQNDRIEWVQSFHPRDEKELAILARAFKVDNSNLHVETAAAEVPKETIDDVRMIVDSSEYEDVFANLNQKGYMVYEMEGEYFCIDRMSTHVFSIEQQGIIMPQKDIHKNASLQQQGNRNTQKSSLGRPLRGGGGGKASDGINWNPDDDNRYGEYDDERTWLKK